MSSTCVLILTVALSLMPLCAQVPPKASQAEQAMTLEEALETEGLTDLDSAQSSTLIHVPKPADDLMASYPGVEVDGQRYAVVEGDLLLDEEQLSLREYSLRLQLMQERLNRAAERAGVRGAEASPATVQLAADSAEGTVVRWRPGKILTYAVLRDSFPDAAAWEAVKASLEAATSDWERTCGVDFQHLPERDGSASLAASGCTFVVRFIDQGGAIVASSFFPADPADRRRLLIDPTWFTSSYDRTGVLRHELGHILGFRHEHVRPGAPSLCPDEPLARLFPLTDYDSHSVMHYFCGNAGTHELKLTEQDIQGSRTVYGPPLGQFLYVD